MASFPSVFFKQKNHSFHYLTRYIWSLEMKIKSWNTDRRCRDLYEREKDEDKKAGSVTGGRGQDFLQFS